MAARGLWIELIAIAHQAAPYGHVLVNGRQPDAPTLARMCGCGPAEFDALIAELESNGVFSRRRDGVIYSRRMVQDEKRRAHAAKIGKKGGNPTLDKTKTIPAQDNPPDKREVKPPDKPQRPETRKPESTNDQQRSLDTARAREARGPIIAGAALPPGDLIAMLDRIVAVVGATPQTAMWDARPLSAWLERGADFERDVLPTIEAVMQKRRKQGNREPSTLRYFDSAVAEAHAARKGSAVGRLTGPAQTKPDYARLVGKGSTP